VTAGGDGGGGGGGEQKKITGPVNRATATVGQAAGESACVAGGGRYRRLPHKPARGSAGLSLPATLATRDCDCHATLLPEHVILHFTLDTLPPNGAPRLPPARRRLPAIAVLPARPAVSPAISSQLPFTHHLLAVTLTTLYVHPRSSSHHAWPCLAPRP
jgi:hypothetical protein